MKYVSTRDPQRIEVSAATAISRGLAPDGGLYVPTSFPQFKEYLGKSYNELAHAVLMLYLTDFSEGELQEAIGSAYRHYQPVRLNGDYLELYHGATLAFKDVALQLFPHLLTASLKKTGVEKTAVIVTATSGDTGPAVLAGIADVPGIKAFVFYPNNGVSPVQRLQMTTNEGKNVHVFGIEGNFDDAQNGVKDIFADEAFKEKFSSDYLFTSANSINIGRLLPQVVYYFYSYAQLVESGRIQDGEPVNYVVPTGNFGNILAGYYAKQMGLPIGKLICATNKNDVLDEFFKTGVYNGDRDFHLTLSPSMDILISSNLERLTSGDGADLGTFASGSATDEQTLAKIQEVFRETGYVIDPHTAVAKTVADRYQLESGDKTLTLVVSTAAPHKFSETVETAIGQKLERSPEQIRGLHEKQVLHPGIANDLKSAIQEVLACS
ncbi:MAG: threonine synthase [Turicibacter sp.]|nr:threonine synthase [Turicibacter sp.]